MSIRTYMDIVLEAENELAGPKTISFTSLPEDMQTLIGQFVLDRAHPLVDEVPQALPVMRIVVSMIPDIELEDDGAEYTDEHLRRYKAGEDFCGDRGQLHAMCMDLTKTPPVVIVNGRFLDGRHRLWQAKRTGAETLPAIDLTGLVPRTNTGMAAVPPGAIIR